jgi:hypothetical protein
MLAYIIIRKFLLNLQTLVFTDSHLVGSPASFTLVWKIASILADDLGALSATYIRGMNRGIENVSAH